MANLTGTQKKKRNQFIALLVAIVVVLAAIFYVAYSAFMAKSDFLENQDFASALATAFDKSARSVSQEDLASVKYLEVYNDGENASVYLGHDDFIEQFDKYMAEVEAYEVASEAGLEELPEVTAEHPVYLAKAGAFEGGEEISLDDIKYFTGAEVISVSSVMLDAEALGQFKNLRQANFSYCGLDNEAIASLASGLNFENVEELVFAGESIDDWSPLESISDKVTIQGYGLQMDENGQYTVVPTEQTLTEYLEELAKAEEEAANQAAEGETAEGEATEEAAPAEETSEATEETTEVTE